MAKGKYEYWLTDDGLLLLAGWARDGLTDEQIAHNMGVSVRTLSNYKEKHLPILQALKKGKEIVDIEVENALLKKALGHKETVRKPMRIKVDRDTEQIVYADEEVYIPPDTTAQIFWLKNRKPEQWRDKPAPATSIDEINEGIISIAELIQNPKQNREMPNDE